jgi:REP element-mobilizing transposase RayT
MAGRRSIRLPGFDYTQPGGYFVTICTYMRQDLFGIVTDGEVFLTEAGRIAARHWLRIPSLFTEITLDAWVVMPNHLHGIVVMGTRRGEAFVGPGAGMAGSSTPNASPLPSPACGTQTDSFGAIVQGASLPNASPLPPNRARGTTTRSLAAAIQNYKSICARRINQLRNSPGKPVWQRNYYEHVIRGESELRRLREYILANPAQWQEDSGDIPTT